MAPQYILRRQTLEDIPSTQDAGTAAFGVNALAHAVWHRATEEEKRTLIGDWFMGRARAEFGRPGVHNMVAVCRDDETGVEEIAGLASWRQPLTEVDPNAGKTDEQLAAEKAAKRATWPACVDASVLDAWNKHNEEIVCREIGEEEKKGMWRPDVVYVHPKHQRKGVCSMLMRWGLAEADKSEADAYVIATTVGRLAYKALGFEDIYYSETIGGPHHLMIRRCNGNRA